MRDIQNNTFAPPDVVEGEEGREHAPQVEPQAARRADRHVDGQAARPIDPEAAPPVAPSVGQSDAPPVDDSGDLRAFISDLVRGVTQHVRGVEDRIKRFELSTKKRFKRVEDKLDQVLEMFAGRSAADDQRGRRQRDDDDDDDNGRGDDGRRQVVDSRPVDAGGGSVGDQGIDDVPMI